MICMLAAEEAFCIERRLFYAKVPPGIDPLEIQDSVKIRIWFCYLQMLLELLKDGRNHKWECHAENGQLLDVVKTLECVAEDVNETRAFCLELSESSIFFPKVVSCPHDRYIRFVVIGAYKKFHTFKWDQWKSSMELHSAYGLQKLHLLARHHDDESQDLLLNGTFEAYGYDKTKHIDEFLKKVTFD